MGFSSGVNYIIILRCVEFSKLSPDINPSVAKEDMVNIVCFTLVQACKFVTARFCSRAN